MKSRRELLEEFLAQDPDDSFSRYALALELEKEGDPDRALTELAEVIDRNPNYVGAYYHLGRLLSKAGRTDEARAIYERGLGVATSSDDRRTRSELQEALDELES